jgi:hypothetical protein
MSIGFHKIKNGRMANAGGNATALRLAEQIRRDPNALAQLERAKHTQNTAPLTPASSPSAVMTLTVSLHPMLTALRRCMAELESLCESAGIVLPVTSDAQTLRHHCQQLRMTVAEARSKCRRHDLVARRRLLIRTLHADGWTQVRIGKALGCDHGTVGHALRKSNNQFPILNER